MNYLFTFLAAICLNISDGNHKHNGVSSIKILFIGNSLTYTNDLPALVKEIGKQDSTTINFTSRCFPNYSLEDHWNDGSIQKEIVSGHYDFVIAQQGPSALQESQVLLIEYAKKIADVCKANGSRFCLYTVWPSKARLFDLDGVISSYKKAAEQTGSLLAPGGLAWKLAWQKDPQLQLYGPDEFHPSTRGSLLAAMTIYSCMKEKSDLNFLKNKNASWQSEVTDPELQTLKSVLVKMFTPDN